MHTSRLGKYSGVLRIVSTSPDGFASVCDECTLLKYGRSSPCKRGVSAHRLPGEADSWNLEAELAPRLKKAFLSSTARDLVDYRQAVASAINQMDGWKCIRMEDFGARATTPDTFCREMVPQCELFIGLIGHLQGSVPKGKMRSYSEREYEVAKLSGISRLMFFADKTFLLSMDLWEEAVASRASIHRFRERVRRECIGDVFTFGAGAPQDLGMKVATAISNHGQRNVTPPRRAERVPTAKVSSLGAIEQQYLAFLYDRYQSLEFKGMGVADCVPRTFPLLEMYVPLRARMSLPEGETWSEDLRLAERWVAKEEWHEAGSIARPQAVLDILRRAPGLILIGDPGAGKSTFLKMLAVSIAGGRSSEPWLSDLVPFLVSASAYADALSRGEVRIDQFIARDFRERVDDLPIEDVLKEALTKGRCLLLLDGLDEVRERSLQRLLVARFQDFYSLHRKAGNKFVLTSRIVGYRDVRPSCPGLAEGTLVDFSEEEIHEYLDRWMKLLESSSRSKASALGGSVERERAELLNAVQHNSAVRALAANPLLLTILTVMKHQGVALPEQRAKLYNVYIKTLLETWHVARGISGKAAPEQSAGELLSTLVPLALWIQETAPGVGLVRQSGLRRHLETIYRARGEIDTESATETFLQAIEKSSLLLERGSGRYGFIHRSFLEYLAAYALAELAQEGCFKLYAAIVSHLGEPTWREVLLLAIGHLGVVSDREEMAGNVLLNLVDRQPGPPGEAVVFAGQALTDVGPNGVSPSVREKVVDALVRIMREGGAVRALRRVQAGEVLAILGDPRPEVLTLEGMQFCWVPPGPFMMGSSPHEDEAVDRERPQHWCKLVRGFWIGRYPVTVAQYREYCEKTGRWPDETWVLSQLASKPVGFVSWFEARSFCSWLTDLARARLWLPGNYLVDLPSEAEWEKAARGGLELPGAVEPCTWEALHQGTQLKVPNPLPARRYPWGDRESIEAASCRNHGLNRATPVGCFAEGVSPLGCEEMGGNLWEWTRSLWGMDPASPKFPYPYNPDDGREATSAGALVLRVLRGGSFLSDSRGVRCACRSWDSPDFRFDFGFRVVLRSP